MKRLLLTVPLALLALWALSGATLADDSANTVRTNINGFQEVPPKLTDGHGTLTLHLKGDSIDYSLTYSGFKTPVLFAHLHFAQKAVNGGIFTFLCSGMGKPDCPPFGTVTGTIKAADIVSPVPDQNLAKGDFAGAVRIIRSGNAYVNVHTEQFPAGEIRGQIRATQTDD
jgi:hypothetical protein